MKNIFKLFSLMLAAGTLMVGCTKTPETPTHQTPKYTITVNANNDAYGTVTGGGVYDSAATATLTATANEGYKFVNWADDNANNPRIVTVTSNATYTANFEELAGVNVTFGDMNWAAQYVNCQYLARGNQGAIQVAAAQTNDPQQMPIVVMTNVWQSNPTTGTYTGSVEYSQGVTQQGVILYYFESTGLTLQYQDGSEETIGDWWGTDVTLNITKLEADAMLLSCVANATMAHGSELLENNYNWAACTRRPFTLNVINQSMTPVSKGLKITVPASAKIMAR
ncbi:MAG: hypothetical protein IJL48_06470 [Bacteroidales bacterium]|nr:hypothetical protein [Bacteroidales bacterium]